MTNHYRPLVLNDVQQLDFEHQRCIARDSRPALRTVCQARGTDQPALSAHAYALKAFGPAWNHPRQREGRGLAPIHRTVEDRAVSKRPVVVHLDSVVGCRAGTGAGSHFQDDDPRFRTLGPFETGLLVHECGRQRQLALCGSGDSRFHERLYLRAILVKVDVGVQAKSRVAQTALYERELVRRETGGDNILAECLTERVEDLLIFGLWRAAGGN